MSSRRTILALLALCGLIALAISCRDLGFGSGPAGSQEPPRPALVKPFAMGSPDVVLLITGGSNGRLELCNCSGPMPGGLSRRSGLVQSYRAAFGRVVLLDSGDALWFDPNSPRNEFVPRAYRQMGYDALTLGDQEWGLSASRMAEFFVPGPMAYLSTTAAPTAGVRAFPLAKVVKKEWGGLKLAVLSDIRRSSMYLAAERKGEVVFADEDECSRMTRELKAQGYAVVVIAHAREEEVRRTAAECPADLIIRGHTTQSEPNLLTYGGRAVAKVGGPEYVGVVAMKISGGAVTAMEYRLETADEHWPVDRRMVAIHQAYFHQALRLASPQGADVNCVPSDQCAGCHQKQYDQWQTTRHAHAYATLVNAGRQQDATCLLCHVSGLETSKGFVSIEATPGLANVNCQDCHRVNLDGHGHPTPVPPVTENTCDPCHASAGAFDYKNKVHAVQH